MLDERTTFQEDPPENAEGPMRATPAETPSAEDVDQHVLKKLEIENQTADLIIGITRVFNSEQSYDAAMNGVLEMISRVLHPERLILFERGEKTTSCTFEWRAPGVPPQRHHMQNLPNEQFDTMGKLADSKRMLEAKVDDIKNVNEQVGSHFRNVGVSRMMAVPLMDNGTIIGYLSANNFQLEEGLDAKRVLDTVASFISSRVINQRLMTKLELAGTHDELTGLLNRRGIDNAIEERLAEDPDGFYVLMLVDVDDFKTVNDYYGHDVGDAALKALADSIVNAFPESAIVGRNGGDEYLVMLFGSDAEKADALIGALSEKELGCTLNGEHYDLSLSGGYAAYPTQASSLQDAYAKADEALYSVKLAGKSGIARYSSNVDPQYRSQLGFSARDIVDNIPGAVMVYRTTGDNEILFANDEMVELLEYDDYADFMSHTEGTFPSIVHPDDRSRVLGENTQQAKPTGATGKSAIEYRVVTKSGAAKPIVAISRLTGIPKIGNVYYALIIDEL